MKEWRCILLHSQKGVDPLNGSGIREKNTINKINFISCVFISSTGTIQELERIPLTKVT
jgi:hypothetical protein